MEKHKAGRLLNKRRSSYTPRHRSGAEPRRIQQASTRRRVQADSLSSSQESAWSSKREGSRASTRENAWRAANARLRNDERAGSKGGRGTRKASSRSIERAYSRDRAHPSSRRGRRAAALETPEGSQRKKLKIAIIIVLAVLVAFIAAAAIYSAVFLSSINNNIKMPEETKGALDKVLVAPDNPDAFYILIVGSDARDELGLGLSHGVGRSDTMMLVRVDKEAPLMTIISIPRDIEVQLPGYGSQKINAAYAYGGPAGAVEAVTKLFGVPISYYVEIDFVGMISLVDTLGGIEVYVPVDMTVDGVYVPAGHQHLNGAQALAFSRERSFATGDLVRVEHQREVMQAIVMKILAADVMSMPGLITELSVNFQTTMELPKAIDMAMGFRGMNSENMYMATVPVDFNSHDGIAYLKVVEPDFSHMVSRVERGLPPEGSITNTD
ncbi:MAG: LCP family protein [Coriobacteriia bacterium]|nr:LCP family protein [Coriobacteriia bacterium]